jgi:hypothetical protein
LVQIRKGFFLITKEEAFILFSRWRDDATPIRVVAKLTSLSFDFEAVIIEFDWRRFALRLSGEHNFFELEFGECTFNFGRGTDSIETALDCLRSDGEIFFIGSFG